MFKPVCAVDVLMQKKRDGFDDLELDLEEVWGGEPV